MTITCKIISTPIPAKPESESWAVVHVEGDRLVEVATNIASVELAELLIRREPNHLHGDFAVRRNFTVAVPGQDGTVELRMDFAKAAWFAKFPHKGFADALRRVTGGYGPVAPVRHNTDIKCKVIRAAAPATPPSARWVVTYAGMKYPGPDFATAELAMNHAESIPGGPYDVRRIVTPGRAEDLGELSLTMSWKMAREISSIAVGRSSSLANAITEQIGL